MRINEKKLVDIIIKIGSGADAGKGVFDRKYIYPLRNNPLIINLSTSNLMNFIRGLAILENSQDYCFGSTSIISSLLKTLKLRSDINRQSVTDLTNWLLANRINSYVPFGINLDLEIKSVEDYQKYLQIKESHRQKMTKKTAQISNEAKKRNNIITEEHKAIAMKNNDERKAVMRILKKLVPMSRFRRIVESDRPIAFFTEEFSELSGEELNKIPLDLLKKMQVKLRQAPKKSAWHVLRKLIESWLADYDKKINNSEIISNKIK